LPSRTVPRHRKLRRCRDLGQRRFDKRWRGTRRRGSILGEKVRSRSRPVLFIRSMRRCENRLRGPNRSRFRPRASSPPTWRAPEFSDAPRGEEPGRGGVNKRCARGLPIDWAPRGERLLVNRLRRLTPLRSIFSRTCRADQRPDPAPIYIRSA